MQQCAGQCQPLPLAAGQVAAALVSGVSSPSIERRKSARFTCSSAPHSAPSSAPGRGHPQVVGHRTFKEVAAQADERYIFRSWPR